MSSKGDSSGSSQNEHADQEHAREDARALEPLDADWHARSMAAAVGRQPPPFAQLLSHPPPAQAEQSSLAAGLGVHAERSAHQPSLFRARSNRANSSPSGNTMEEDLGSQDEQAAEPGAQAAATAADSWHALPAISPAAGKSGTNVKELTPGGLPILLRTRSSLGIALACCKDLSVRSHMPLSTSSSVS